MNNTRTDYKFKFNGILKEQCGQEEVFDKVGSQAVQNALDGFNSTIFAYGQTGSGKTFTITGGSERYVDRGIIPRAISMLFSEVRSHNSLLMLLYILWILTLPPPIPPYSPPLAVRQKYRNPVQLLHQLPRNLQR